MTGGRPISRVSLVDRIEVPSSAPAARVGPNSACQLTATGTWRSLATSILVMSITRGAPSVAVWAPGPAAVPGVDANRDGADARITCTPCPCVALAVRPAVPPRPPGPKSSTWVADAGADEMERATAGQLTMRVACDATTVGIMSPSMHLCHAHGGSWRVNTSPRQRHGSITCTHRRSDPSSAYTGSRRSSPLRVMPRRSRTSAETVATEAAC